MSKRIAIWGSSGSGKSMFACILASVLTRTKEKAIIISPDSYTPMLPVWLPDQNIEPDSSLGQALSAVEIDTALVASKVTVLKSNPFIGLMGYATGETPLSYPQPTRDAVTHLISAVSKLVDFVILDCTSCMANFFTPTAIETADVVLRILTPDLKGVNYLKAQQPLLLDPRFRYSEHMVFAGMARPFHAIEETSYVIGGWSGLLPYGKELERCGTEGGMFRALEYCGPKYAASLNKVLERLQSNTDDEAWESVKSAQQRQHADNDCGGTPLEVLSNEKPE